MPAGLAGAGARVALDVHRRVAVLRLDVARGVAVVLRRDLDVLADAAGLTAAAAALPAATGWGAAGVGEAPTPAGALAVAALPAAGLLLLLVLADALDDVVEGLVEVAVEVARFEIHCV